jgi:hypothetical protein
MASKKQRVNSEQTWQRGFSALKNFKRREGHCRVPRHHLEGNYKLGQWVAVQRYINDTLAPKRKATLNELGFMWSRSEWLWEKVTTHNPSLYFPLIYAAGTTQWPSRALKAFSAATPFPTSEEKYNEQRTQAAAQ